MANVRREIVGYKPLRLDPIQPEGLLAVARVGGELESKVAAFMFRLADEAGAVADRQAQAAGERAGRQAALAGRPGQISVTPGAQSPEMAGGTAAPSRPSAMRQTIDLSASRQKFIDTLMPAAIEASQRTGVDPRIIVAQAAQETGWGKSAPGNNYFGIKSHGQGGGQTLTTHEVINGKRVKIRDSFRQFASPQDSVAGYADFITRNQRYTSFRNAQGLDAQLSALQASGYATDPNYSNAVGAIARSISFAGGTNTAPAAPAGRTPLAAGAGAAHPTPAQVAAPAVVTRMPTDPTFRSTGRDTVFGRAYDAAGTRTFLQLLDSEIRSTTAQAFRAHENDPGQLAATLDTLKRVQLRDDVPEEIQAEYEVAFEAQAQRYLFQAQANADRLQKEENLAAFEVRSNDLATDIERRLEAFDPALPGVENLIADAQVAIDDHYDAAVSHGLMTPTQGERAKAKSRSDTSVAFYLRQADGLAADDVAGMRETMRADFAAGRLSGVDGAGWRRLEAGLQDAETVKRREATAIRAGVDSEGTRLADRALAGFEIPQDQFNRFVIDAGKSNDDELVAGALAKIEAAEIMRDRPLGEAFAHVEKMRAELGDAPSDAAIAAVTYAEERVQQLAKLIDTDPAGYEIQRGRLKIEPIALDSPEAMDASLAVRRDQMRGLAERYARPVQYLRPGEATALARAIKENPEAFPEFAASVASVFGRDAGTVLAEIAPEAPTLAHAAGIMAATGDRTLATDLAQAISAKSKGEWKVKMPSEQRYMATALPMLGTSLAYMDGTRASVLATAQLLLERDANLYGFDPAEVHKPESQAHASLMRAIDRALGAQMVGGEKTGGIGTVNGAPIVLPTGMSEDRAQRLMRGLSDDDLAALPPIRSANGVAIRPDQLRFANLVTIGDGRYHVALGDPLGLDPRFVAGGDGELWVLDLNAVDARRRAQPGLPIWGTPARTAE